MMKLRLWEAGISAQVTELLIGTDKLCEFKFAWLWAGLPLFFEDDTKFFGRFLMIKNVKKFPFSGL